MEIVCPEVQSLPSDPFLQILQRGFVIKQRGFEQHHSTRFNDVIQNRKLISVIPMEHQIASSCPCGENDIPDHRSILFAPEALIGDMNPGTVSP